MISSLFTYIQFFSAIYVTICIDNLIGRRFWSPNYYELVTGELAIFKNSISTPKQELLKQQIWQKAGQLDDFSRRRGSMMLFYCVSLMFYNSFEPDYIERLPSESDLMAYYFPFAVLLLVSLILPCFYSSILKRWRYLAVAFILQTILFVVLLYVKNLIVLPDWLGLICYTKWAIAIILPMPILYQLYINWLYSTAYLCHLRWEVRDEYEKYKKSKTAYEKKSKEMADESYYQAFTNILLGENPDNVLTELNNTLYEHLKTRCSPPSAWKLFTSWNEKKDKELPEISPSDYPEEENLPVGKELKKNN